MKQYSFDHYYIYSEMTTVLQELAAEYPGLIKMHSICTTADGHEVWATEITNYATGGALEKPAYYVDGSHHAGEVTGSMAAIHLIVTLVQGYGKKTISQICWTISLSMSSPASAPTARRRC